MDTHTHTHTNTQYALLPHADVMLPLGSEGRGAEAWEGGRRVQKVGEVDEKRQ